MAMKIDLKPGELLRVGDATIKMVKKSGQLVSLVIEADKSVPITREGNGGESRPSRVVVAPG